MRPLRCPQKPDVDCSSCGACPLETEYTALRAKYAALALENQRLRQMLDYIRAAALSVPQLDQN